VIAIVDYGAGNITSVARAVEHLGYRCEVGCDPSLFENADRIIVPGVGHFRSTQVLRERGMTAAIQRQIAMGTPLLGICLGMQWLFQFSDEAPELPGLAAISGGCRRFSPEVKSPHVGWNQIEVRGQCRLLSGIPSGAFVYFTHGYRAPVLPETAAITHYGGSFTAAVERGNLFGTQFHPEKSGDTGLAILENFFKC
jgi:glutamine amidotransferase